MSVSATATGAVLQLNAVDKIYNPGSRRAVHAVKSLSMTVEAGEIVALLGSSGCGKTSTLRMIAGFEPVSGGSIELAGRSIETLAPAARGVAMAFEGYSLYPPLTVRENIEFALKSARAGAAEIKRRVDEIVQLLNIEDILGRYPSSISGGQQQRASLGRALVRDADLHLLDEPMGQLEPQLRALLRGRIKHFIKERGLTAILVTHDQTEANALADRIAVMEDGVLQQYAPSEDLKDRPANLFTGTFIGEPPMNVFVAEVDTSAADDGRLRLQLAGGVTLDYAVQQFAEPVRAMLLALAPARVVLGVRPHAVRLNAQSTVAVADSEHHKTPTARVLTSQWLGDQTHVAAEFADGLLVAVEHQRRTSTATRGDRVSVELTPADLHFFSADDAGSGAALAHGKELA